MNVSNQDLEQTLSTALRESEAGTPRTALESHADVAPWLEVHDALVELPQVEVPLGARLRGQQRMMAALAEVPAANTGFLGIRAFASTLPKAAALLIGGLVLTGGAVGASAAAGGPNLPAVLLEAVGIHVHPVEDIQATPTGTATGGTDASATGGANAPQAAPTPATATATPSATSTSTPATATPVEPNGNGRGASSEHAGGPGGNGIEHAPDAAQNGKEHANPRANLGGANADAATPNGKPASPDPKDAPELKGNSGSAGQAQGGGAEPAKPGVGNAERTADDKTQGNGLDKGKGTR